MSVERLCGLALLYIWMTKDSAQLEIIGYLTVKQNLLVSSSS